MTVNPIVAASIERPRNALSGAWIVEDIELIAQGIRSGSWIDGSLGMVGAGLDALALISDPVGTLLQYGVAWIIEHVRPLSEVLDWLAGDPSKIEAHVQTWRNASAELRGEAADLAGAVRAEVADWSGAAGDAYRMWATRQEQAIGALARAADTMATITESAGLLVASVRTLVRDAIATLVSRLVVYAAEEVASLGLATPLMAEQVSSLVGAWSAKIARWLRSLIGSLRVLAGHAEQLERLILALRKTLRSARGGGPGPRRQRGEARKPPPHVGGPSDFDPQQLRGLSIEDVRARIPDDWIRVSSSGGGGDVFRDPVHRGRQIRIMPGYPPGSRPDPAAWGPYAVVSQNGSAVKVPLEGNPTLG